MSMPASTPNPAPATTTPTPVDRPVTRLAQVPVPARLFPRAAVPRGSKGALSPASLPSGRLEVADAGWSLDELAAYSRVCGYGLGGPVPATWLHVRTFGLQMALMTGRTGESFPLRLLGLVHIANRWTVHAPVGPQDRPTLSVWSEGLTRHPKGALVTLGARAELDGQVVWEGWSDYLARGARLADEVPDVAPVDLLAAATGIDAAALPERAVWRLGAGTGRRYAGVSGDANPIHLSALSAKAFGFPRAIAHGMYTAARAVAAVGPMVPERHRIAVQFAKPLLLPSTAVLRSQAVGERGQGVDLAVTGKDASRVHMTGVVRPLGG